ncbi:Zinc finger SWIM-type [Arabidopsis thaliana x Arabidopsis arenosa]|uniref:Zinc finger SWIM-type n=1 Tax=Arabidopsis thaliana x Arabidopsis arenosa TaxID=1240361 RepID=A0A8T2A6K4_9BRAS|nr:Zinc finger SWIM-type [Arabidopsis thaliana x Arabidopsis arenosa]
MAMLVRLVRGEWRKDDEGRYEHVSALEGFTMAVRLRETDGYNKVVTSVKERLALRDTDNIELSYQWPQWMMGPEWKRADPIYILNDEDMTLFMAIRADLEEVHLRVKVIRGGLEKNVNSFTSHLDLGGLTSEEISDKYWNSAETRAVWDSALTRLLTRNAGLDKRNSIELQQQEHGEIDRPRSLNLNGGIRIQEPLNATPLKNAVSSQADNTEKRKATAGEKGKGHVTEAAAFKTAHTNGLACKEMFEAAQTSTVPDFEAFRRNYIAEMWRDVCATEMTLGGQQGGTVQANVVTKTARELNFGVTLSQQTPAEDESLRLTLSGASMATNQRTILTLSSSDSSFGTPTSPSTSISFSTEDLMDAEIGNQSPTGVIGPTAMEDYYTDPDGPLCLTPRVPIAGGLTIGTPVMEKGSGSTQGEQVPEGDRQMVVRETPVPTVLYDRDAPPYFDDPGEEDYLQRALKDADYEGDDIFVGRLFKNKDDCCTKLAIHAIRRKFHFIHAKSCPTMVIAVCVGTTCPWRVYATKLEDSERFEVRTVILQHTCSVDARGDFHKQASTAVIGKLMRTRYVGVGRGPRPNELRRMLRQEFSLNVSYWKAWRAREIAMDNAMGSAMGSFALIQPYFKLLMATNPNSITALETETDNLGVTRFKYLFFALHASIKGYAYMRKVIVIDGTHLRGRYGGCLVAASAQDANFQVFPLAFGIVNSENDEAWTWFMTKLTDVVPDEPDLVFVSDRHASIYASIRKVYPMASHAACVVHLKRNIIAIFKNEALGSLVSSAARAYRLCDFNKIFAEIRAMNGPCADYLTGIGFEHWTRSHFVGERYNVMTSNIAETLNNVLTMARDYPVISILESWRTTLVTWFALRREAARMEENILPPKVNDMVIENFEKGAGFGVLKIGDGLYEVRDMVDCGYAVNLWERTCTCRQFQLLTIPCSHAIAAAIREGIRVDTMVGVHHTVPQLRSAYKELIMPVPDMATLAPSPNDIGGGKLAPPYVRRPPGRPRKRRLFSRGEFKRTSGKRCTRCRSLGHNRATCRGPMMGCSFLTPATLQSLLLHYWAASSPVLLHSLLLRFVSLSNNQVMSQFSTSASSQLTSRTIHRGVPSRCWCGDEITTFTSKTDENPYRRFYRCVRGVLDKKEKHLFSWVDDALLEEIRMVESKHNQLLEDIKDLKKMMMENVELQSKMGKEMEIEMNKMKNEIIEQKLKVPKESTEKASMKTVAVLVVVVVSMAWIWGKVL